MTESDIPTDFVLCCQYKGLWNDPIQGWVEIPNTEGAPNISALLTLVDRYIAMYGYGNNVRMESNLLPQSLTQAHIFLNKGADGRQCTLTSRDELRSPIERQQLGRNDLEPAFQAVMGKTLLEFGN